MNPALSAELRIPRPTTPITPDGITSSGSASNTIELLSGASAVVRPVGFADEGLILGPWKAQIRASALIPRTHIDQYKDLVLAELMRRSTLVACDPNDALHAYGWVCGRVCGHTPIVHGLWVKEVYRPLGLEDRLIDILGGNGEIFTTHRTRPLERALRKRGGAYCPEFLALEIASWKSAA